MYEILLESCIIIEMKMFQNTFIPLPLWKLEQEKLIFLDTFISLDKLQ